MKTLQFALTFFFGVARGSQYLRKSTILPNVKPIKLRNVLPVSRAKSSRLHSDASNHHRLPSAKGHVDNRHLLGAVHFLGQGCLDLPENPSDAGWTLLRKEDSHVGPFPLGFNFNLFGINYGEVIVHARGFIAFGNRYPRVSAFEGDIDRRGDNGGEVLYKSDGNMFAVTWIEVAHYSYGTLHNTFQVIITDGQQAGTEIGKNVCFCYGDMQWATGGSGGSGGTPSIAGIVKTKFGGISGELIGTFNELSDIYRGPLPSDPPSGVYWLINQSFCYDGSGEDTENPEAVCKDHEVLLDASGNADIVPEDVDDGSSDNVGIASLTLDQTHFTCADVGEAGVVLTVTDTSGNTDTCTADITVDDEAPPTAVCKDISVQLVSGTASINGVDIDGGSSDACGIASLDASQEQFLCEDVGIQQVELTVTDVNGNSASCDANVNVMDQELPIAKCRDISVQLLSDGVVSITGSEVDDGSLDECGVDSLDAVPNQFLCGDVGNNQVTLTVTDVNGNSASCVANVNVLDQEAPNAIGQGVTVFLSDVGEASIAANDVDGGSTDNCQILSSAVDQNSFSCSDVGVNTIELTVTDVNGNTGTDYADVTVLDVSPPYAACRNLVVPVTTGGTATISKNDIDDGSTDNCGIESLAVNQDVFTCADIGDNPIELLVTDVNGNTSTCQATVTVFSAIFDIKFCGNPNRFNCKGKGVLPMTIFASEHLDPSEIDVQSIRLCLEDGTTCISGANSIRSTVLEDRGNPTDAGASECAINKETGEQEQFLNPDGLDDLEVAWEKADVVETLLGNCNEICNHSSGPRFVLTFDAGDATISSCSVGSAGIDQLFIHNGGKKSCRKMK